MTRRPLAIAMVSAVLAIAAVGCGDDDAPAPQKPVQPTPTAAATPGAAGGSKNLLAEKQHIEDRVVCPIPDKPSDAGAKCDPKAPSCAEHLYCLQLPQGYFCEPCPERDAIRHVFKERDFAAEQNRDPFQSFLLPQIPTGGKTPFVPIDPTKKCLRSDQMVASNYGYADLKLVGIVAAGTQRKVLMVVGREGYIIKRGDCVGKEKAVVKDIGTGYVTFQVDGDTASVVQRPPQEYSVALNPKQLTVAEPGDLPSTAPRTTITPVIPPPAVLPPRAQPPGAPPSGGSGAAAPAAGSGSAGAGATPGSAVAPPVESPPAPAKKS